MSLELIIDDAGHVRCVYGEEIDLEALGSVQIRRASQVEPDGRGRWTADLTLSGGPVLAGHKTRSQAIAAEVDWIRAKLEGATTDGNQESQESNADQRD